MFKLIVISVLIGVILCDNSDQLVSVVLVYRHGDRVPINPYPNDPYRNASYWPAGWGQLTNRGKWQHYQLGQWLRARYNGFLPPIYSEQDICIRSTDTDRTLMSAEANLAGLYPPKNKQIWDPDIPWQPIPVHTSEQFDDNLLSMGKPCPKYNELLNELFQTDFFVNISHKNHDLYAYLTKYTGRVIASLEDMEFLYNTLYIETLYNLTLPSWAQVVYPDRLKIWAEMSFATPTWTQDLARLRTGPLFNEIVEHFINATSNATDYRKFLVFSAHDITISNVLNTVGAFQYHCPPYASTIIFELRQSNADGSFYVNVFYKNSSQPLNITLKDCNFDCKLEDFIQILEPVLIAPDEWEIECQLSWVYNLHFDRFQYLVLLVIVISTLCILFTIVLIFRCCKRIPIQGAPIYMKLPNDEVA